MKKKNELLVLVSLIGILVLVGIAGYYIMSTTGRSKTSESQEPDVVTDSTSETDINTPEYVNQFDASTTKLRSGSFEKIENGRIYIRDRSFTIDFPLNNEIIIVCSQKELTTITENEYGNSEVIVRGPEGLNEFITSGEFILAFTQELGSTPTIHTIYVPSTSCPSE